MEREVTPLPWELWRLIRACLATRDIVRHSRVCRQWYRDTNVCIRVLKRGYVRRLSFSRGALWPHLVELRVSAKNIAFCDAHLLQCPNLRSLVLLGTLQVTDAGLSSLTALQRLEIGLCGGISSSCIASLTTLTRLDLSSFSRIKSQALRQLTGLTSLSLADNTSVNGLALLPLTRLTALDLTGNNVISNNTLRQLTQLTSLSLRDNDVITDDGLYSLLALRTLDLRENDVIRGRHLSRLTALTTLRLDPGFVFDRHEGIQQLTMWYSLKQGLKSVIY